MKESCRYRQIGGWWQSGGTNAKGNNDEFEIDIVAETLEGEVEAIEVKRKADKYDPKRLREKVSVMQRHLFQGRDVKALWLSMEDM